VTNKFLNIKNSSWRTTAILKNVYLQPFDFAFSAFAYSALTLFVQSINQSINQELPK